MTFGMTIVTLYLRGKERVLDETGVVFLTKLVKGVIGVEPEGGVVLTG